MSDSLRPHGLQHARPPCPSPNPRACSNSCPSSQWCHPTVSSSVIPFSSCLQSFAASGSFPMSQFFTSGNQSNGASASVSIVPMNIQDWFPLGLTGLISLQFKGLSRVFYQYHSSKASTLWCSAFFIVQVTHPYMASGKTIALTRRTLFGKVMSLLFNHKNLRSFFAFDCQIVSSLMVTYRSFFLPQRWGTIFYLGFWQNIWVSIMNGLLDGAGL